MKVWGAWPRAAWVGPVVVLVCALWGTRARAARAGPELMPLHPSVLRQMQAEGFDSVTAVSLAHLAERRRTQGIDQPEPIRAPLTGTRPAIVLLVEFPDLAHAAASTPAGYQDLLFSSGTHASPGSMRDFYRKNSRDAFDIAPGLVDAAWRQVAHDHAYYADADGQRGTSDDYGLGDYPGNAQGLVVEAVTAADPYVDFASFAVGGVVEGLFVIHAGRGAETDPSHRDWIWSHKWALGAHALTVDGVKVDTYSMEPECTWAPGDSTIGVFAHEYGHVLGLPDLYDVDYTSEGLGDWSVMAGGSWNGGGASPACLDAWSRVQLGWADLQTPTATTLGEQLPAAERTGAVTRLWSSNMSDTEYFLLENRQRMTGDFDAALPGDGLLLYHVDENADQSNDWYPRVMVEQADGRWDLQYGNNRGDAGDPYPGTSNNRSASVATLPSTRTYAGADSQVSLTAISDSQDTMTLNIGLAAAGPALAVQPESLTFLASAGSTPAPQTVSIANRGAGPLTWTASSDAAWLQLTPSAGAAPAVLQVTTDPEGLGFGLHIGRITISAGTGVENSPQVVAVVLSVGLAAGWPRVTGGPVEGSPTLADLEGDGDLELIVGSDDGFVYAWHYDGAPVAGWPQQTGGPVSGSPAVADFDGDGKPEVIAGSEDGKLYAWHQDGTALAGWPKDTGSEIRQVAPAVADLDGDGEPEVVIASEGRYVYAWRADGTSPVGWPRTIDASGAAGSTPALADLDGDGRLEVVLGGNDGELFVWNRMGALPEGWPKTFASPFLAPVALGDLNGDGKAELEAADSDEVSVWDARGTSLLGWPQRARYIGPGGPALGDLDGDGKPEVVIGTWSDLTRNLRSNLFAWSGSGSVLAGWPVTLGGLISSSPAFADLEGDGALEVVVGCDDGNVYALHGDGTAASGWPVAAGSAIGASSPAIGDMNGDGRLEIAIGGSDGRVSVWSYDHATADTRAWLTFRHDPRRTGQYRAPGLLTVLADPAEGGVVTGEDVYVYGATATVTATAAAGWLFDAWQGPVANAGQTTTTVQVTADAVVRAHFVSETAALHADFQATPRAGARPLTVTFTDRSEGSPATWAWSFGDGGASTVQNPSHDYTAAGAYTVGLTVTNDGASDTETRAGYVTVSTGPPAADFSATPRAGPRPLTVQFTDLSTNDPTTWSWAFGDGSTSPEQNPAHVYQSPGEYTVSLRAANGDGTDTETRTSYISVNPPSPRADFTATPRTGVVPLTVQFADLSTGGPATWLWVFGDGQSADQRNPEHSYSSPGSYTVSLTVTNVGGDDTRSRADFIVVTRPPLPAADFTATPTAGQAPLTVQFTDRSDGRPTAWQWDFGDGAAASEQNPVHIYTTVGGFAVTLTVTNRTGSSSHTVAGLIQVLPPPPVARFSSQPAFGAAPLTVQCTDASEGAPAAWQWDFGDGTTATEPDPSHTYQTPGRYTITLTATNAGGSSTARAEAPILVTFPDVPVAPDPFWALDQIIDCAVAGVATGYPDGLYHPEGGLTRDQMAVYLARAVTGGERPIPTPPAQASFPDVPVGYWAYKYIEFCKAHDLAHGYPDGYHPAEPVTRAQMAVSIARAVAGGDSKVPSAPVIASFADVPNSYWAFRYIEYCHFLAIVQGYQDDYRPEGMVTRDQMAVFVARAFGLSR